jgi:DHA2 family multidrug resistance protein-like MFS transporter
VVRLGVPAGAAGDATLLVLGPRVLAEYRDPQPGRLDLVSAAMSLVAVLTVVFGLEQGAQGGVAGLPSPPWWLVWRSCAASGTCPTR